jgi:hypothetical protein
MSEEEFEVFLRKKVEEIVNKAADNLFDEIVDEVMGEKEEGQQGQQGALVDGGKSKGDIEDSLDGRQKKAAAIKEACNSQVRSSPRLQGSRDEHTLAKAEERAARRNLEFRGGTPISTPLLPDNCSNILNVFKGLGVNVRESSLVRDHNLISLLDLEVEKEVVEEGEENRFWTDFESDEEILENLERDALKSLCGEMMEEVFDETSFPLNSEISGLTRKGKFRAKSCLRKTCKVGRAKGLNNSVK